MEHGKIIEGTYRSYLGLKTKIIREIRVIRGWFFGFLRVNHGEMLAILNKNSIIKYMSKLQKHIPIILQIAGKHGAQKVRVFGSFAAGTSTTTSDLDLLVNLEQGRDLFDLIAFKQELEEQIGRKVDVVTEKGLSPHLRDAILTQAKPL